MQKSKKISEKLSPADRVLRRLEAARSWVSGEDLAEQLGVSRAAVAKQVNALRDSGHVIRSRTRTGYFLEIKAERIERRLVEPFLQTTVLGRREWIILDQASSTNSEAIARALDGAEAGSIVTAECQTQGKGRKGHDWFSSPRGLSVSILLRPENAGDPGDVATIAALEAMRETVAAVSGLEAAIKMPNDLLLSGKKICGILAETGLRGGEADWVALGSGCNINVTREEFPETIRDKVTSLYCAAGRVFSKNEILGRFLTALEPRLFPRRGSPISSGRDRNV